MTSTEFTAGIGDSARVSSKVLKPPGGGSSDIFGLGRSGNQPGSEKGGESNTTHSRLFGNPSDPLPPIHQKKNTLHQSSIFQNGNEAAPVNTRGKRVVVRRNPITGEEIVVETENEGNNDCNNKEVKVTEPEVTSSAPSKPVTTSIRVRNPPGGKSSGIF